MKELVLKFFSNWRVFVPVTLVTFLVVVVVFQLLYPNDKILPSTTITGEVVVGKNQTDFAMMASQKLASSSIKFIDDDFSFVVDLGNITPPLIPSESIQQPQYLFWQKLIPFSLWLQRRDVNSFRITQENEQIKIALEDIAKQRNKLPVDASVGIKDGVVEIFPSKNGRELDITSTLANLARQPLSLGTENEIQLVFQNIAPHRSDDDITSLKQSAEELINQPVSFTLPDGTILASTASDQANWLSVAANESDGLSLVLDEAKVTDFVQQKIASRIYREPTPTVITLLDGRETSRQSGNSGITVDLSDITTILRSDWLPHATNQRLNLKVKTLTLEPPKRFVSNYSNSQVGLQTYYNTLADQNIKVVFKQFGGAGWQAGIGQNDSVVAASTYKLFVALRLFDEVNSGRSSWQDEILSGQTAEQCLRSMIVLSRNDCAEAWLERWGRSNINNYLYNRGISRVTTFTDAVAARTSAADLALLLEKFYYRDWFNFEDGALLNTYMVEQVYRRGVPAGSSGTVADKVGFLWDYLHDASLVYHPKGNYVLVILTKGANWSKIADITRQTEAIVYP